MGEVKEIQLHRRAEMALDAFPAAERKKVERALDLLRDPTAVEFVAANVRKSRSGDSTFIMRASPEIRILFGKTDDGDIQILDVVRRDKLMSFAGRSAPAASSASLRKRMPRPRARRKRQVGGSDNL